jgi:monovalent cation/proton antiporter MnhG/PhaG subunit
VSPDTPAAVAVLLLLAFALLVCTLSCLGLLVMKGFYNKLHYLAPPAVLATAALAAAILYQEGAGSCALKAGLVFLVMALSNPILTYAAARANYLRETHIQHKQKQPER